MTQMVNPYDALVSYQQALNDKLINPDVCKLHTNLTVLFEDFDQQFRFTYALTENGIVKGIVLFVRADPIDNIVCFSIGYAVSEIFQNQGIAKEIIEKSIDELKNGFKDLLPQFYIEAIINVNNEASKKIALKIISDSPKETIDEHSGSPAYQFVRLIN
ncbi:MAG: GNAT family N-acetyltransferase [Providencia sp.]|uniref:GNAT family N-acetyltransferase n=1 Tax=Providencia sp. TaxID=589 RepID=UPI003F968A37